ncbi:MAG: hypothetical protein M5U12_33020 [Verrucomicrobia bacterium]|nr:hypothetical protein [Verrucomicrobiota bacterium]
MCPRIGISVGDVTGVGPEVTLKALARLLAEPAAVDAPRYLLLGDAGWLERANRQLRLPLEPDRGAATPGRLGFLDPRSQPLPAQLTAGAARRRWRRWTGCARARRGVFAVSSTPWSPRR